MISRHDQLAVKYPSKTARRDAVKTLNAQLNIEEERLHNLKVACGGSWARDSGEEEDIYAQENAVGYIEEDLDILLDMLDSS